MLRNKSFRIETASMMHRFELLFDFVFHHYILLRIHVSDTSSAITYV